MKAKISELKARLSAYLDEVRKGNWVTIFDRKTPIARIVPLDKQEDGFRVTPATRSPKEIGKIRGVRPKRPVNVVKLLAELR